MCMLYMQPLLYILVCFCMYIRICIYDVFSITIIEPSPKKFCYHIMRRVVRISERSKYILSHSFHCNKQSMCTLPLLFCVNSVACDIVLIKYMSTCIS